jgi:hypothetical protein
VSSERLIVYRAAGRLQAAVGEAPTAETNAADPAETVRRGLAEARKDVAAVQIKQLKVAARDAGVLSLLNPRGAISFAKHAATTLSSAVHTFGESEAVLAEIEDVKVADVAGEEVTVIARDVIARHLTLELTVGDEGLDDIDAAIDRLKGKSSSTADASTASDPSAESGAQRRLTFEEASLVEATTIVTLRDESMAEALKASIAVERSERLGQDAEVIKDAITTLRRLGGIIAAATKRLGETGGLDRRAAGEVSEAREAFFDAIAETAQAALPVVRAGYSILPDEAP